MGRPRKTPPVDLVDELEDDLKKRADAPKLYASIRLVHNAAGSRLGSLPGIVEASEGRTIEFRKEPFEHFAVLPLGIQIPLTNVIQSIPLNAQASVKVSRAGRLAARKARIEAKLQGKEPTVDKIRRAAAEEIVDEDDTDFGEDVVEGVPDAEG